MVALRYDYLVRRLLSRILLRLAIGGFLVFQMVDGLVDLVLELEELVVVPGATPTARAGKFVAAELEGVLYLLLAADQPILRGRIGHVVGKEGMRVDRAVVEELIEVVFVIIDGAVPVVKPSPRLVRPYPL